MEASPQSSEDAGAVHSVTDPINRNAAEPYYLQLASRIRSRISDGSISMGERLPSENEIVRLWDVSRATVREALRMLEEQGWVVRIARRGAFASMPEQRGWMLQGREGFFEDEVEGRSRQVTTHVLRAEMAVLPASAAEALHLPENRPGYVLERLRELDGHVALLSTNYLPPHVGAMIARSDVATGKGSLNALLREAGHSVAGAWRKIEAVAASGTVAERLRVEPGSPLLRIVSTSWGHDLVAFDHHETWVISDVVRVEVQVGATPQVVRASVANSLGVGMMESP